MKSFEKKWTKNEWGIMKDKLRKLSLDDVLTIANKTGVMFEGGNENIVDTKKMTAKEQFILVLDEVPKDILKKEYFRVVDRKNK